MMRADVHRRRTEVMQLAEQLLAVFHRRVVGLVIAKPALDRRVWAQRLLKVHLHRGFSGRGSTCDPLQRGGTDEE
jgi:hypothetical protein